jgi:hypothetical protein
VRKSSSPTFIITVLNNWRTKQHKLRPHCIFLLTHCCDKGDNRLIHLIINFFIYSNINLFVVCLLCIAMSTWCMESEELFFQFLFYHLKYKICIFVVFISHIKEYFLSREFSLIGKTLYYIYWKLEFKSRLSYLSTLKVECPATNHLTQKKIMVSVKTSFEVHLGLVCPKIWKHTNVLHLFNFSLV